MNVYDFDETIFVGDTEDRFFKFVFAKKGFHHYKLVFKFWDLMQQWHITTKTIAREHQYSFLKKIDKVDNLDQILEDYWDSIMQYMKPWYDKVKRDDDIIATGSPRFLLEPGLKRLGLHNMIATEMDPKTGKIDGDFAVGEFKPVNFEAMFPFDVMDKFYSDAYSDHYLAEHAKEAYVIHDGEEQTEWNAYFKAHPEKMK